LSTEGEGAVITAATSGAAGAADDLTFLPGDVIVESGFELVAERAVKE